MFDPRASGAFRSLLAALAVEPDAAAAAIEAYSALDGAGRDAWLDALDAELPHVDVPVIAAYAPVASVERDPTRRARIVATLERAGATLPSREVTHALVGRIDQDRIITLVVPLYGAFVEQLTCRVHPTEGVRWARHTPLWRLDDVPRAGDELDGATLERLPPAVALDEVAHAVLAARRAATPLPAALSALIDLLL